MATDLQVITAAKKDLTWLQAHEKLILAGMLLVGSLALGNWYLNSSAQWANSQAVVAVRIATEAKENAQQAAQNAAQTQAAYQAMVDALSRQNAALAGAITQRDAVLGKQQAAVNTAPLTEVGRTWQDAIGVGTIVSSTGGLTADDQAARKTVTMLLELPVTKANLADTQKIAGNLQTELDGANKNIAALGTQVTALNGQIVADGNACKAQIASVKADARKSKRNWFIFGFISGFISRQVIKTETGF